MSEGRCKLGIIRYPLEFEKYYSQVLKENGLEDKLIWKYEPVVLMSENHPLADREEVRYEELAEFTEILHGDINLSMAFSDFNERHGVQNRIYVFERGSQMSLLQTNVDTYMWVAPMPERILEQNGLILKRCTDMKMCIRDRKDLGSCACGSCTQRMRREIRDRGEQPASGLHEIESGSHPVSLL